MVEQFGKIVTAHNRQFFTQKGSIIDDLLGPKYISGYKSSINIQLLGVYVELGEMDKNPCRRNFITFTSPPSF